MSLTARTLADTLRLAAEEAATLRRFIDDLDGWDGHDLDTGSNAARSLEALAEATASLHENVSLATALDIAVESGVTYGVGHCGQMITLLLQSWSASLGGILDVTPVRLRTMLKASLRSESGAMALSPALSVLISQSSEELDLFGETLPEIGELIGAYAAHCQFALVEATNQSTGRIDPGAAVFTLLVTCLDAIVRDDVALLASFAQMLADLAASSQSRGPRAHSPGEDRAFTVDMIVAGSQSDLLEVLERMRVLGARYSYVGNVDFFGVGEWRIHADTAVPLALFPRHMTVRGFTVCDARPHEQLGVDGLSDALTHHGVHILERPSLKRVERAHVIVLTHAPGMVEAYAQAGAVVVLAPSTADAYYLHNLVRASDTGVTLLIPTSERTGDLSQMLSDKAPANTTIMVAQSCDDLTALALTHATATTFVPQPGGREAASALMAILSGAMHHALSQIRTVPLNDGAVEEISQAVEELNVFGAQAFRVLLGNQADPQTVTIVQHLILGARTIHGDVLDNGATLEPVEVFEGHFDGASLLQGTL